MERKRRGGSGVKVATEARGGATEAGAGQSGPAPATRGRGGGGGRLPARLLELLLLLLLLLGLCVGDHEALLEGGEEEEDGETRGVKVGSQCISGSHSKIIKTRHQSVGSRPQL